jgi:hypothetical protein
MMKATIINKVRPVLTMLATKEDGSPEAVGTVPDGGLIVPIPS